MYMMMSETNWLPGESRKKRLRLSMNTTRRQRKQICLQRYGPAGENPYGFHSKLGAGTNVQDRLIALHHLDCPWKPSDVGRILRTFKIKKNVEVTDNGKIII